MIREKASAKSKKLGDLKKNTKLIVYLKTKSDWSEIRYKKKAYVATKDLNFIIPTKKVSSSEEKVSYLLDKTKIYVYRDSGGATEYKSKLFG